MHQKNDGQPEETSTNGNGDEGYSDARSETNAQEENAGSGNHKVKKYRWGGEAEKQPTLEKANSKPRWRRKTGRVQ